MTSCLKSQSKNNLIPNNEQLFYATNLLPITFGIILSSNQRNTKIKNSQNSPGTMDINKFQKVHTIKILLDSGDSASIVHKDVPHNIVRFINVKRINGQLWQGLVIQLLSGVKVTTPGIN